MKYDMLDAYITLGNALKTIERLEAENERFKECWIWQEDGNNHLESMANELEVLIHAQKIRDLCADLTRYKTAEAEGRLVELPCKVGDTVRFDGAGEVVINRIEAWVNYDTAKDSTCGRKIYNSKYSKKYLKIEVIEPSESEGAYRRLMCKPGDIVYFIVSDYSHIENRRVRFVQSIKITEITIYETGADYVCHRRRYTTDDFGKTVFLTHSEAQAALEAQEK